MLNQAVLEAMYSVPYVETYLDIIENLPDEIQRFLTKIRELDVNYQSHMKEIEIIFNKNNQNDHNSKLDMSSKKRNLMKIQVALISAQEIGDEKLKLMQQVQDIIESRTRPIDDIFYNLPSVVTSELINKEKKEKEGSNGSGENNVDVNNTKQEENISNNVNNGNSNGKEKDKVNETNNEQITPAPRKRTRRKLETDTSELIEYSSTPLPRSSATIAVPKKNSSDNCSKKKKRKPRQGKEQKKEASPPPDEDLDIDPDEPTYCLCNRVSFGQMVMCDNDLCSLQWFHFSCVGVTNTPRGKWYCPKCRKVKSNAGQPKKQLIEKVEKK